MFRKADRLLDVSLGCVRAARDRLLSLHGSTALNNIASMKPVFNNGICRRLSSSAAAKSSRLNARRIF